MKNGEKSQMIILTGIILPSEWDARGRITKLSLSTFDEEEYLLDFGDKEKELLLLVRKEVEIKGTLQKSPYQKRIKVESYNLIHDDAAEKSRIEKMPLPSH